MKCSVCGHTVNSEYRYCPHCGNPITTREQLRQIIDESFNNLEEIVEGDTLMRLENLSNRLVSMEKELDSFLLTAK